MTDIRTPLEIEEDENFPIEPRYHPIHKISRKIYDFLASAKLAMALLVIILVSCLTGVTIWRGPEAGRLVFASLWFNSLLVLLVLNVACCFFGRIWHRKLTLIIFGMILFHLSFVVILGGIVYNSLNYFRGVIRLTEGETLPNNQLQSYDNVDHGRYFSLTRLKGETTLVKMHTGYKVDGSDKRVAYEVLIGDGNQKTKGILYATHNMDFNGIKYFPDREGYSVQVDLYGKQSELLYGAIIPLQSFKQQNGDYKYTTGTKDGPENIPYPQNPMSPVLGLQVSYSPSKLEERGGDALFQVWKIKQDGTPEEKFSAEGKAAIGSKFYTGEYSLSVSEVRYWTAMNVRYEPGQPVILTSLWVGLAGMVITTFGRIWKGKKRVVC